MCYQVWLKPIKCEIYILAKAIRHELSVSVLFSEAKRGKKRVIQGF